MTPGMYSGERVVLIDLTSWFDCVVYHTLYTMFKVRSDHRSPGEKEPPQTNRQNERASEGCNKKGGTL